MSYITKNTPNVELVKIFEKLPTEDLVKLLHQCKDGNYGVLATAIASASLKTGTQNGVV